jgi:hypothetical protein
MFLWMIIIQVVFDYQSDNTNEFPFGKNLHAMTFDVVWKLSLANKN